ncbi:MAG: hypothetical protein NVS4B4_13130 [Bradyrhizobium sp.]
MVSRTGISLKWMRGPAIAALATLATAATGWPQGAAPPPTLGIREPAAPPTPSPSPQPNEESPGLLDGMGKLFEKSLSIFPTLKSLGESAEEFNARAKDAGDSVSRLAKPSTMVAGRTICPASTNGAPDCKLGADKLCQAKGFKEGKSLNTDSAETCSPKVLIPGRTRKPDDCRTDNYVTSALCQ